MTLDNIWGNEQVKRAVEIAQKGKLTIKFIGRSTTQLFLDYCKENNITAIAFMPCACGNLKDQNKPCSCETETLKKHQEAIKQYKADLTIEVTSFTGDLKRMKLPCELNDQSYALLQQAVKIMGLNQLDLLSILKVARVISELGNSNKIEPCHIAEALQYRDRG